MLNTLHSPTLWSGARLAYVSTKKLKYMAMGTPQAPTLKSLLKLLVRDPTEKVPMRFGPTAFCVWFVFGPDFERISSDSNVLY